jgi:hypothetical protein
MFVNGSDQNEQSLERTFHRCFLPSFTSFRWGVSEEKIKMWKVNGRRMPSDGKSSHCLWQGELKRDDLNFPIVSFPFICSNIPAANISKLIRYWRACGPYHDFLDRGLFLTRKPLNRGFLLVKLKLSLRKFYCHHRALVKRYGVSESQMTMNMFWLL